MKRTLNKARRNHLDPETDALRGMLVTIAVIAAVIAGIAWAWPVK